MIRLPPLKNDQLSASQIKVIKAIQNGPRGDIPMTGPFGVWLRAGNIGDAIQNLGADYVLLDTYMEIPEDTLTHEPAWAMMTTVAESILDLSAESVR